MNIANITGYKFTPIEDTSNLQKDISNCSNKLKLKGTVLISNKGLNFSIAGTLDNVDTFIEFLYSYKRFKYIPI